MNEVLSSQPIFQLMAVIGVVGGLFTLYEHIPVLLPILFACSAVGLGIRWYQLVLERRRQSDSTVDIDYKLLAQKDIFRSVAEIKKGLRGHDDVIDRIVARLQQNLSLAAPGRTLGAFLLVGPTGTGKTYLAELVAKALYPGTAPLILQMNQYKDHQDVFTLIGPPPGYAGYEVGGAVTRPVIENPYRAIVLNEFEKCHRDVQHCTYEILDRAQCTEKSSGKAVHFDACVFFATCNAGVETLRGIWAETKDPVVRSGRALEALAREGFEKALLARFDEIHFMDELGPVHVAEVACLQIVKYWKDFGIEVTYTSPEVLVEAVRRNVEFKDYGVRQLARLIQEITRPSIEEARRQGVKRVRIDLDASQSRIQVAAV